MTPNYSHPSRGAAPIILIVLVVALAGGYAYQKNIGGVAEKIRNVLSITPEDPDVFLAKSFENLADVHSLRFSGESTGNMKDGLALPSTVLPPQSSRASLATVGYNGSIDLTAMDFGGHFSIDVRGAKSLRLVLEVRKVASTTYFRISEAPDELSFLSGSWIMIDLTKDAKKYGQNEAAERVAKFDRNKLKAFLALAKKHELFRVKEELPKEEVNGVMTRHFKFVIDRAAFREMSGGVSGQPLTTEKEARLNKIFATLDQYENEVWVGKRDLLPHKFTVRHMGNAVSHESAVALSSSLLLSDFNKPVEIGQPASAKTLEEVLRSMLGNMFPNIDVKKR